MMMSHRVHTHTHMERRTKRRTERPSLNIFQCLLRSPWWR